MTTVRVEESPFCTKPEVDSRLLLVDADGGGTGFPFSFTHWYVALGLYMLGALSFVSPILKRAFDGLSEGWGIGES